MSGPHGFGGALDALKEGRRVFREGWNGKGMLIELVTAAPANPLPGVIYRDYIAMRTAQNEIVPWVASQTDVLAIDWFVEE